jgi:hypothetical protein
MSRKLCTKKRFFLSLFFVVKSLKRRQTDGFLSERPEAFFCGVDRRTFITRAFCKVKERTTEDGTMAEASSLTTVSGILPTLQNIVATVNLDCRLDLKTIALHARNAEYNPKVCLSTYVCMYGLANLIRGPLALCGCHYAD